MASINPFTGPLLDSARSYCLLILDNAPPQQARNTRVLGPKARLRERDFSEAVRADRSHQPGLRLAYGVRQATIVT